MTEQTPSSRYGQLPTLELPSFLEFLKLKNFPLKTFPTVNEPDRPTKDTLYIYGPGYRNNQASFDVDCLIIQMYLLFCGIEFDIDCLNEPAASPSGQLPFLATVTGAIYDSPHILDWIKNTRHKEKELASERDREQSKAFLTLVQNKLRAALLFSMWLEPLNANQTIHKAYFGNIPKPVDMVVAYNKQNQVVQSLLADHDILVREEIYQDASQALEALSVKLGQDTYFFGSSEPTFVDAVVFSYLHSILSMPHILDGEYSEEERKQAGTLAKLVRKHDNLVAYAKSIYEQWLK
ncbi:uncharacterized protein B0P05DRAFT_600683 [Gilbertella persicaria]|uniref:uncharacterized protein n=1 Tax=Gilbertella persicaria TaxID=101096 RepID=UPI00221F94E5|nr:uncharacterized protein B0P05DRAFT_600683 [Gilbertella persicaria]KAI8049431.1 hypothetical protein B0P05DRAFT_600683 [Gilbertella persicaria]